MVLCNRICFSDIECLVLLADVLFDAGELRNVCDVSVKQSFLMLNSGDDVRICTSRGQSFDESGWELMDDEESCFRCLPWPWEPIPPKCLKSGPGPCEPR